MDLGLSIDILYILKIIRLVGFDLRIDAKKSENECFINDYRTRRLKDF